jgi:hypothetical protein
MAFDRQAALAEGYTEDEINAYLQAEAAKKQETPVVADVGEPPAPQTKFEAVGSTPSSVATTAGLGLAPYAVPAAGVAAAALGGGKLYSGWREGVNAANEMSRVSAQNAATHAATQEMKTLRQIAQGTGPEAQAAQQRLTQLIQSRGGAPVSAPVAPTGAAPVAGPVAPAGMPAPAQSPGVMAQLRAFAANKILPAAGNIARGSVGPAMLFHSGDLGPKTPQVGRMRGMEINPLTGAPWTPEQIKQYEGNPQMFDSQMAQPQMRR